MLIAVYTDGGPRTSARCVAGMAGAGVQPWPVPAGMDAGITAMRLPVLFVVSIFLYLTKLISSCSTHRKIGRGTFSLYEFNS